MQCFCRLHLRLVHERAAAARALWCSEKLNPKPVASSKTLNQRQAHNPPTCIAVKAMPRVTPPQLEATISSCCSVTHSTLAQPLHDPYMRRGRGRGGWQGVFT